jgi:antitoxin component YwqK of YwqJK toxin-antitoxin module
VTENFFRVTLGMTTSIFHKLITIILFSISSFAVYGYTPGKWSPLDRNVLGFEQLGPASEIVKSSDGKVIYTAYYEYDNKGRLSLEKFLDSEGKPHGETRYSYEKDKLILEETFSSQGLQDKRVFKYNTQGDLKEIILTDADGKEVQRCKVVFMNREFIADGELKWAQPKDTEFFNIKKSSQSDPIWIQEITDEKKKQVATIKLHFDEGGKLIKRENIQMGSKRKSELKYDESGRLKEFNYYILNDTNWILLKIHYLEY